MIAGLVVFLVGSILAGFSWSMLSLICFRVLQGLGAGAIQPTTMTIVSDLFTLDERRKTQSYMATVWGVSAIVGPLAGALIVQHISWAWVFWINVPLGVLTVTGLMLFFHEKVEAHDRPVDFIGAALFCLGVVALLLAISPTSGASFLSHPLTFAVIFAVCAPLFVMWERYVREPMMEFDLWSEPVIASANGATLAAGVAMIGLTACLPVYIQAVLGRSPVVSGLTLTAMAVGWPIAATFSARVLLPIMGMRLTMRVGAAAVLAGALVFPFLNPSNGVWLSSGGAFVMGCGMGMMSYTSVLLLQASVDWSRRGAATASNVFARLLGNTLGAAVMGAILNLGLKLAGANLSSDQVRALMDHRIGGGAVTLANQGLKAALASSMHWVFLAMLALAALTMAAAWAMPQPQVDEPFRRVRVKPAE